MAAFGEINPHIKIKTMSELLPARGANVYSSGIRDGDKGYIRYAHASSKYPNLIILNPIYDDDGNVILPGYYELVLSDDRTMLVLAQSQQIYATIPVFKLEEDKSKEPMAQPMDNKSQRKFDKAQAKKEKLLKKKVRAGEIPSTEPEIYMNATIQRDDEGGYYLIKYERDKIRAWGAIK